LSPWGDVGLMIFYQKKSLKKPKCNRLRETLYYTIRENLRSLAVLFCWVRVGTQSVVFYVVVLQMIVGLFVGFVWSLYCLYFDIRQPITRYQKSNQNRRIQIEEALTTQWSKENV
jgi:hypothetical protein